MRPLRLNLGIDFNFSSFSPEKLLLHASDDKSAFQYYYEGWIEDHPISLYYPGHENRKPKHFDRINFRDPEFVHAIEGYLIDSSRAILNLAPQKNLEKEVRTIFGKAALDLIDMGYLPMSQSYFRAVPRMDLKAANSNGVAGGSLGTLLSFSNYRPEPH